MKTFFILPLLGALTLGQESHPLEISDRPAPKTVTVVDAKQVSELQAVNAALKQENAQLREALRVLGERHDKLAMSLNGCLGPLPQVPPPSKEGTR